ncbi:TPA: hypothetical protein ACGO1T_000560 [Streptococcus suis]
MAKYIGKIKDPQDIVNKEYVDNNFFTKTDGVVHISDTPPEDTALFWLDTNDQSAGQEQPAAAPAIQDTGWRDITSLTNPPADITVASNGRIFLRRQNNTVWMAFMNYNWSAPKAHQFFFPPELCAYTVPPTIDRVQMRGGVAFSAGDRMNVVFTTDWLGPTNLRLNCHSNLICHGVGSWLTDTPFPENPLGKLVP